MRSVVEVVECTKVDMLVTEKLCCAHQVLFMNPPPQAPSFVHLQSTHQKPHLSDDG
jgi:hypothetical protein